MADVVRTQLDDELVEDIAGGMLHYVANPVEGYYVWTDADPEAKYAYNGVDYREVRTWVMQHCGGMKDLQKINALLEAGLIIPM